MKIKSVAVDPKKTKAGPDDGLEEGQFIVYPSTFVRKADAYGDVVMRGAFAEDIAEWAKSGNVLPGLYGHRMDDPDYFVAGAIEEGEDEHGWWVKGEFDLENPKARQVYRLVKGRRLNQLSFAYDVLEEARITLEDGTKVNELRKLKRYEFSFVPVGANQTTSVVAVKALADSLRSGTILSSTKATVDSITEARDALNSVLEALAAEDDSQNDEASDEDEAKSGDKTSEEPAGAKQGDVDKWYAKLLQAQIRGMEIG